MKLVAPSWARPHPLLLPIVTEYMIIPFLWPHSAYESTIFPILTTVQPTKWLVTVTSSSRTPAFCESDLSISICCWLPPLSKWSTTQSCIVHWGSPGFMIWSTHIPVGECNWSWPLSKSVESWFIPGEADRFDLPPNAFSVSFTKLYRQDIPRNHMTKERKNGGLDWESRMWVGGGGKIMASEFM